MGADNQTEIFGHITLPSGESVALDAHGFSTYIKTNYISLDYIFKQSFVDYMDTHVMRDVRAKLLDGMDEVSVEYVKNHERMVHYVINANDCLVKQQAFWTDTDRYLFKRHDEWVAKGEPAFLKQVNLEWSSSYTNLYGMYDVLPLLSKVKKSELHDEVAANLKVEADSDDMVEVNYQDRFNGKAVVDIGGYIGDTVILFRDLYSLSKIYAFEPQSGNYESMIKTLSADVASGRVIPVKTGLGDKSDTLRISGFQGKVDATASVTADYNIPEFYEDVPVITFDSYVKEHQLEVGVIKIDVEGFEVEIVKGALDTIKSQRPLLVVAIYHNAPEFYELKSYLEDLNLGYKFCIRRSTLGSPSTDLVLIAYPD